MTSIRTAAHRLQVPGSSANLGPGFDSLAVALGVYLTCKFQAAQTTSVHVTGRDAELISASKSNLVVATAEAVAKRISRTLPPFHLEMHNEIPLGKGMGSSAAAIVAGVEIANRLLNLEWDAGRLLDEAARIEGHPDNVSASIYGSIVASAVDAAGIAYAVKLPIPDKIRIGIVVPNYKLPTKESRAVLPECYSRADATFNVQRVALLVAALATGNTSVFPAAIEDRMHQPFRAHLVPGLAEVLRLRAPGLHGCVLSGAGPAILVFHDRESEHVCELVRQIFAINGSTTELLAAGICQKGLQLS